MALAATVIAPAVVLTAISLVGLAVRRRFERAGAALIGAVGVVQTLAIAPFALPALAQPNSPVDFLHAIVSLLAGVTMAVAAVALLRRRAGAPRRLALAGALAMVVGVAIAGVATVATTSDALDPGQIEVVAERNTWAPTGVSATSSSVLYVDNRDLFHHTFTVDALGIDVDLPAATARTVSLDGAVPGVYDIVCDVPGHEDMVGTLEITG
jgi:heme/copper-type cytochrome/quinol oxidase subunit 2